MAKKGRNSPHVKPGSRWWGSATMPRKKPQPLPVDIAQLDQKLHVDDAMDAVAAAMFQMSDKMAEAAAKINQVAAADHAALTQAALAALKSTQAAQLPSAVVNPLPGWEHSLTPLPSNPVGGPPPQYVSNPIGGPSPVLVDHGLYPTAQTSSKELEEAQAHRSDRHVNRHIAKVRRKLDRLQAEQKRRSRKYGITAFDHVADLTRPSCWEHLPADDFADPVNFLGPLISPDHVTAVWRVMRDRVGGYTEADVRIIRDRIIRKARELFELELVDDAFVRVPRGRAPGTESRRLEF